MLAGSRNRRRWRRSNTRRTRSAVPGRTGRQSLTSPASRSRLSRIPVMNRKSWVLTFSTSSVSSPPGPSSLNWVWTIDGNKALAMDSTELSTLAGTSAASQFGDQGEPLSDPFLAGLRRKLLDQVLKARHRLQSADHGQDRTAQPKDSKRGGKVRPAGAAISSRLPPGSATPIGSSTSTPLTGQNPRRSRAITGRGA